MAVWKSREGKVPPSNWYGMLIAHLRESFPKAEFNEEDLKTLLQPTWDEQWRNGNSAKTVAATTCSCDGRTIQPSPGVYVNLPRGAARGPANLPRGVIPDPAQLRESLDLERLKKAALAAANRAKSYQDQLAKLAARSNPRDQAALDKAQQKQRAIRAKYDAELLNLAALRQDIESERSKVEMEFVKGLPALPDAPVKKAGEDLDIVLGIKPPKEKPAKAEKPEKPAKAEKPAKTEKPPKAEKAKKPTQAERDAASMKMFAETMAAALAKTKKA